MPSLPVTYSVICTDSLLKDVIPQFNIDNVISCEFWCQGLNDSYKITTTGSTFLLRIYRHQWRNLDQVKFELDALLHLHANGADVAHPIATRKGDWVVSFTAPEGERHAILTSYINGHELDFSSPNDATIYAEHMAQLHQSSADFTSHYQRFKLDVQHLVKEPLQSINPFLCNRQDDWVFMNSYANSLAEQLKNALTQSQDIGLCHGDLHGGNAHLNKTRLSSFDFDCCGIGLRVYDLAVFKWSLKTEKREKREECIWQQFLQSYQKIRPIADSDLALIDGLVAIRHIWLMGLHIDIAVAKGWLNEDYFDQKMDFLRTQKRLTEQ